jgi:hypothetical protein
VCARFVAPCRELGLLRNESAPIDGSKFKAVNTRAKNFTRAMERRVAQVEESVAGRLIQFQEPSEARAAKMAHFKEKLSKLADELQRTARRVPGLLKVKARRKQYAVQAAVAYAHHAVANAPLSGPRASWVALRHNARRPAAPANASVNKEASVAVEHGTLGVRHEVLTDQSRHEHDILLGVDAYRS